MVHQHPNKTQVTMVAVAEEKRPHTRKRTPTTIVASETMFLQASRAQVTMVAVAEEKRPHTRKKM
jgi:acyl-CoA hydrolase